MRLGSLCTGYGGLDLAVEMTFGPIGHAWHAEIDPDASRVLAHHWPDVPNLGDLTDADWSRVEPVDILTAGFPCQPVSTAGRRAGIDDERWLWDDIADAVGRMDPRPRMLVLENVPGLLTANRGHAMARVIQRLAALGYVGRYRTVRASDAGAPHRRERVFIVAHLAADAEHDGWDGAALTRGTAESAQQRGMLEPQGRDTAPAADAPRVGYGDTGTPCVRRLAAAAVGGGAAAGEMTLLPTPNAAQGRGTGTPSRETAERRMYAEGRRFLDDAVALLPTPTAIHWARNATAGRSPDAKPFDLGWTLADIAYADRWGQYAPAIARWEQVIGRPAPDPTEHGSKGQPRLSPRFVEWLMGLDDGWVTDHLPRNPALRVLGNGVVPRQAAYALAHLAAEVSA